MTKRKPGAVRGRPPLYPSGRMKPVQLTLPPDLIAALEDVGGGNVSEGVRIVTLAWLESNRPAKRELQVWRHTPTGNYYLVAWQGGLSGCAGPMPVERAQATAEGRQPEPEVWPDLADWADAAWERGEMERVGGGNE